MYRRTAIIVDIDNTISYKNQGDVSNIVTRQDWDDFHKRQHYYLPELFQPIKEVVQTIQALYKEYEPIVLFVTAREDTHDGVIKYNTLRFINDNFRFLNDDYKLYMRTENDFSSSSDVKQKILRDEILPNYYVVLAFDDETANKDMFVENGISVLQVFTPLIK